jgi:hypothetical protein
MIRWLRSLRIRIKSGKEKFVKEIYNKDTMALFIYMKISPATSKDFTGEINIDIMVMVTYHRSF